MKLIIDIPESMYEGVMIDRVLDTTVIRILDEIKNGTPLPKGNDVKDLYKRVETLEKQMKEDKDKWKSSYEQMYQEKICELNKRKKELENQLNTSVQNNIENEMIMCCEEG